MRFSILFLDADECSASVPVCNVNANCRNTLGSYQCSCIAGFTRNGKTCTGEISEQSSSVCLLTNWRPLLCVFEVSVKRIDIKVLND